MSNRLETLCAEKGLKMTGQRRILCRVLAESDDHPDIMEIHRRSLEEDPKISVATVYRTMKLFEDVGVVQRHEFGDGRARYEELEETHHDHLIDLTSGKVIEFVNDEIERLQHEIAEKLGYKIQFHRLELYGVPLSEAEKRADADKYAGADKEQAKA